MKYTPTAYAKAFLEVYEKTSHDARSALVKRFLLVIQKNGDLARSDAIIKEIRAFMVKKHGGAVIQVEFARPQYPALVKELMSQFSKKDYVEMSINPALIAGTRITIDGRRELDTTFQRKMNKLFA